MVHMPKYLLSGPKCFRGMLQREIFKKALESLNRQLTFAFPSLPEPCEGNDRKQIFFYFCI